MFVVVIAIDAVAAVVLAVAFFEAALAADPTASAPLALIAHTHISFPGRCNLLSYSLNSRTRTFFLMLDRSLVRFRILLSDKGSSASKSALMFNSSMWSGIEPSEELTLVLFLYCL